MPITLYDLLLNSLSKTHDLDVIISRFGIDTEFEAIARFELESGTGMWSGYLIFKDERFSPPEPEIKGIQFQYALSEHANGVLAETMAERTWTTLVAVFRGLMER